jgi:hypothetical protein
LVILKIPLSDFPEAGETYLCPWPLFRELVALVVALNPEKETPTIRSGCHTLLDDWHLRFMDG